MSPSLPEALPTLILLDLPTVQKTVSAGHDNQSLICQNIYRIQDITEGQPNTAVWMQG